MEPENIDWNNIDSTFVLDETYEYFDAPKWFDFTASNELVFDEEDDETWFCNQGEIFFFKKKSIFRKGFSLFLNITITSFSDCKHRKIAQDLPKPTTTTTKSKAKMLKFASFSEILPFRDRNRR